MELGKHTGARRTRPLVRPGTPTAPEPEDPPAPPELRVRGRIQRILPERGYGFIRCLDGEEDDIGKDFFFHASGLLDTTIDQLEEGAQVIFTVKRVAKGNRAEKIVRVTP